MPDALRLAASLLLSAGLAFCLVPLMVRVAHATSFLDRPAGYKGHGRPTPYLGGAAVIAAFAVTALLFGAGASRFGAILGAAVVLWVVGTVDDRVGLGPGLRVAIEAGAATVLWSSGLGWDIFAADAADLLLTVVWIVGVVNAFNLMDNMDGAAGSVAAASSAGAAGLALVSGDVVLAALVLAIGGACLGFLPANLARPSRIFLGDGGSMPVGFVLGAAVMAVPPQDVGWIALVAAAPLVGLPLLDTALVVVSRTRRGVQVLSGGRDHLTFRLRDRLGTAQRVALALAGTQVLLCAVGLGLSEAGEASALAVTVTYVLAALAAIAVLELPGRPQAAPSARVAMAEEP